MRLRSRRNGTRSRRAGLRVVVWVWNRIAYPYIRFYREQRTFGRRRWILYEIA
jgi:hypothetical protein